MVGMQEGCVVVGFLQKDFLKQMGFLSDDRLLIFGAVYSGFPASI